MPNTDAIVQRAQKKAINLSETQDGSWHAYYIWQGQEYGLDGEEPEALLDDMEALTEILAQDDTYQLEYNEDLDRYIIDVEGETDQFIDQSLAKAFAQAKNAVMTRMQKAEEERKARAASKPEPEVSSGRTTLKQPKRGNGPDPVEAKPLEERAQIPVDLPPEVVKAMVGLLDTLRQLLANEHVMTIALQAERSMRAPDPDQGKIVREAAPFTPPPAEIQTPPKPKRGLKKS